MRNFQGKSSHTATKLKMAEQRQKQRERQRQVTSWTNGKWQVVPTLLLCVTLIKNIALASFLDNDFQFYTRAVLISDRSVNVDAKFNTFERYSASLNRGQLHLEQIDSKSTQTHSSYYSSETLEAGKLLKISSNDLQCKQIDEREMSIDMFGAELIDSMAELKLVLNLLPDLEVNRHVIGLARLLIFFDQNRHQFKLVPQPAGASFKNIEVSLFSLELELGKNVGPLVVRVLLPASVRAANATKVAAGNPMRILFRFTSQVELVVDFDQIGLIQPALANSMFEQLDQLALNSRDSSNKLGASRKLFNFPLGRGCGRFMFPTRPKLTPVARNPTKHPEEIYSFKFQLLRMPIGLALSSSHLQSSFVAYDGLAQLLRVEPVHEIGSISKHQLTIYDFNLGVKFHVSNGVDHSESHLVDRSTSDQQQTRQTICTKTKLSKVELLPSEPILPLSQLVYMGIGEVRGVESAIYETTTKRLPKMIFELTTWLDGNQQNEQSRFELLPNDNNNKSAQVDDHTLVYHLAEDFASGLQQPLRIDVYDSEWQHRFRVELFNFQWRLSEAPNGDHQHQLFTLSQRCELSPDSVSHLMRVNLELTQENATEVELAKELRHSSAARNIQLIRGLSSVSGLLSGGQILNLASRLIVEGNTQTGSPIRLKLFVALSILPKHIVTGPPLLEARRIGTGMVTDHLRHSSNSYTLSECFWEASRWAQAKWSAKSELSARPQVGAIFSFCFSRCWIEPKAQLRRWPNEELNANGSRKSEVKDSMPQFISNSFITSHDTNRDVFPCQLFLIEQQVAQQEPETFILKPIELMEKLNLQLANKTLNVAGLDFKVTRNRVARDQIEEFESNANLKGIAFVLGETKLINETTIVWSANEQRPRAKLLDPESCHALCVANATCRSYSSCFNANGQIECLLSSVDVRQLDFLRELRSKLEQSKLQIKQSTSCENDQISLSAGLNLRVSKRCQVWAKEAKDLFRQIDTNLNKTTNLYVDSLRVVASQEQCAEICLKKNTGYFRRLARFQVEIEAPPDGFDSSQEGMGSNSTSPNLVKPDHLHDRHLDTLRYWCDRYKYLSLTAGSLSAKQLRYQLIELSLPKLKDELKRPGSVGLCYMARGRWARSDIKQVKRDDGAAKPQVSSELPAKLIGIKMSTFEFRYNLLYQRQEGFRLVGVKSANEENKQQVVNVISEQFGADFRLRNLQSIEEQPIDVEFCARQCFTQAVQWCRSFDLIQVDKTFYCVYNSLGLGEFHSIARSLVKSMLNDEAVKQLVFERPSNGTRTRFFHYEPLEAYALDIVKLKLAESDQDHSKSSHQFGSKRFFWLLGFGLGLTLLALMIVNETNRAGRRRDERPTIPEVNIARLSFSLPVGVSANSSLLSQDQLELQHNIQEEQIRLEQINK